jgi:hypothetical protein
MVPPVIDHSYCTLPFAGTDAVLPVEFAQICAAAVMTGADGVVQEVLMFVMEIEDGRGSPFVASWLYLSVTPFWCAT